MDRRRHKRGFERVGGRSGLEQLGLPARRLRELLLAYAWRKVAGELVARRAPATRVSRGVLEVNVPDHRWAEALSAIIPQLAGRLAASCPELGVRRYRFRIGDQPAEPTASPVSPAVDQEGAPEETAETLATSRSRSSASESLSAERLKALAERYLKRTAPLVDGRHGSPYP